MQINKTDTNKKYNMKPDIWGPALWDVLFDVAHYYRGTLDPNTREKLQIFFEYLQYILPCAECRNHSRIFYDMHHSLPLCKEDYGMYMLYPLRNAINRRLGKQDLPVRTYLERRAVIPLSGSKLTLYFICKIFWTIETSKDITIDLSKAKLWCTVAHQLVSPLPNYGSQTWTWEENQSIQPVLRAPSNKPLTIPVDKIQGQLQTGLQQQTALGSR
jgi:hypothetical protein